jgi:hypothetical protein
VNPSRRQSIHSRSSEPQGWHVARLAWLVCWIALKQKVRSMIRFLVLVAGLLILLTNETQAAGRKEHSANMAAVGSLYHDASFRGRENVFYSSNGAFPRLQARAAFRRSPGHRANLPMIGLSVHRDSSGGVYVTGRKH